jgi:hypothetical protein
VSESAADASVPDDNSSVGGKDDDDDDDDDDVADDRMEVNSCADPEKLKAFNVSSITCLSNFMFFPRGSVLPLLSGRPDFLV